MPQYADVFSLAALEMPRNMLEDLVSQYWPLAEPTTGGKSTAVLREDGGESPVLPRAYRIELGYATCAMLSGVQSVDGEAAAW